MTDEVEIEEVFSVGNAEEPFGNSEMGRRTNGKKFGDALNDP